MSKFLIKHYSKKVRPGQGLTFTMCQSLRRDSKYHRDFSFHDRIEQFAANKTVLVLLNRKNSWLMVTYNYDLYNSA
ncbi:MAG TPA: hypothetical protein VJT83_05175 [Chitinophagaceae bacterium]|nr:hypothetical protein [Chitinophagaceae bacterium]